MLRTECDLFDEEQATDEVVLQLHARILEIAETDETAKEIARDMLTLPPVAVLFAAVLSQAHNDGATEIRYELSPTGDQIDCVLLAGGELTEAMTIPHELWSPIYGFATRLRHVGYEHIAPHLRFPTAFPSAVAVSSLDATSIQLVIT